MDNNNRLLLQRMGGGEGAGLNSPTDAPGVWTSSAGPLSPSSGGSW